MKNPFDPNGSHSLSTLVPGLGSAIDDTFPHIAEKIIALWGSGLCMDFLDELMHYHPTDDRPSREGFTLEVIQELSTIYAYHVKKHPFVMCDNTRRRENPWK